MPCTPELLADVELFAHMDAEDRVRLAQFIGGRELPAGELLFQAGQPGEAMYVVKRGEIELYIKDNAGQKIALATVGAGQVFGAAGGQRLAVQVEAGTQGVLAIARRCHIALGAHDSAQLRAGDGLRHAGNLSADTFER